jgi:hypothetical protein
MPRASFGFVFGAFLAIALSLTTRGAVPAPLDEAFQKLARDSGSWAYTEVSVTVDKNGKKSAETIVEFDPSKPFPEQFTPLQIDGRPPTDKQRAQYRRAGESRGRRFEEQENAARDELLRLHVSGRWIVVDLEHATVAEETETSLLYEVALLPDNAANALPAEKFRLQARVNKADRTFEHAELSLREPLKLTKFAKLSALSYRFGFANVDANFSPAAISLHADTTGSMFFFGRHEVREITRRDVRHVTPYRSRFGVKIGPLKTIDF